MTFLRVSRTFKKTQSRETLRSGAKSETFAQRIRQIYSLIRTLCRAGGFTLRAQIANLRYRCRHIRAIRGNGFPLGYCDGTKIVEKRFNITTGTFTAIP